MCADREPPMSCTRRRCGAVERFMGQSDAPLVLGLALVMLTLVCTTSRYLLFKQPESFPLHVPDAINIALMGTASAAIVGLLIWQHVNDNNLCTVVCSWFKKCTTRHEALETCERIAAVIFVIGAFAFHVFRLIADFDCWGEWHSCEEFSIASFHQVGAVRTVCQVVFMLSEFAFCLLFRLGSRRVNSWMLLGLGLVQCANFAMWFDALLDESEILPQAHNSTLELEKCHAFFGNTTFNTSSKYVKCFQKRTKHYKHEENLSPYLYPLNTEFLLLAAKIIFDFLFVESTKTVIGGHRETLCAPADDIDQPEPVGAAALHQSAEDVLFDDDDDNILDHAGGDDRPLYGYQLEDIRDVLDNTEHRTCFLFRTLLFEFTLFEIIFAVFTLATDGAFLYFGIREFYTDDEDKYQRDIFARYRNAYWTMMIAIMLVGYRIVPSAGRSPRRLERFEYFVVLCSVGLFAHILFTLIANVQTTNKTCPTLLFLCEEILNFLQVLSQTAFYVYAAKVREAIGRQKTVKGAVYRAILFHFWVSNLVFWAEDSFVETHNKHKFFQNEYYKHWTIIYNITNPVMICYRLNCMFLFASLYFSDRPEQDGGGQAGADEDAR